MKFSCEDNHMYKKFLEEILKFKDATVLIQDFLDYVDVIDFNDTHTQADNKISLKSSDLADLQEILGDEEFKKIMVNRFVDGLKDMLERNCITHYGVTLNLGEYRELLNTEVQYVTISESDVVYKLNHLTLMERELDRSIKERREKSLEIICENIGPCRKEKSENEFAPNEFAQDNTSSAVTRVNDDIQKNRIDPSHKASSGNPDDIPLLDLITFDKNNGSEYKESVKQWNDFSSDIDQLTETVASDKFLECLRDSIRWLHREISSVKFPSASSWKDLEGILQKEQAELKTSEQTRLQTNFYKVLKQKKYKNLLKFDGNLKEYREKLETRLNTIRNQKAKYIDKKSSSNSQFNLNEVIRLLLYTETDVILKNNFTSGQLDYNNGSIIFENYITLIEELPSHLNTHIASSDTQKAFNNIKLIVMEDLFSTSKFDAIHFFTEMTAKMEDTLSYLLNNTNYNYVSLALPTLVNNMTKMFDEFVKENHNLNRSIIDSKKITNTDLPSNETISQKNEMLLTSKDILQKFQEKYPLSFDMISPRIIDVHNKNNLYNKIK